MKCAEQKANDTLAEWLRRRPAKPMGSPCVGSNPTGVAFPNIIAKVTISTFIIDMNPCLKPCKNNLCNTLLSHSL